MTQKIIVPTGGGGGGHSVKNLRERILDRALCGGGALLDAGVCKTRRRTDFGVYIFCFVLLNLPADICTVL
jgi:hypothetical protein